MGEHKHLYSEGLINKFKDVITKYEIKHLVYVGLPPKDVFRAEKQLWWVDVCDEFGIDYTIIELFEPWAKKLSEEGFDVVCDDVCSYIPDRDDSLLLWSHGPEHVSKSVFEGCISRLSKVYKNMVVAMPYGFWKQGGAVNPFEEHKWHADISDLTSIGFEFVDTNGPKDKFGDLYGVYYE